jgi:hypothetical protein
VPGDVRSPRASPKYSDFREKVRGRGGAWHDGRRAAFRFMRDSKRIGSGLRADSGRRPDVVRGTADTQFGHSRRGGMRPPPSARTPLAPDLPRSVAHGHPRRLADRADASSCPLDQDRRSPRGRRRIPSSDAGSGRARFRVRRYGRECAGGCPTEAASASEPAPHSGCGRHGTHPSDHIPGLAGTDGNASSAHILGHRSRPPPARR